MRQAARVTGPVTPSSQFDSRNRQIDFLRGVSILLVMLSHFGYSGANSEPLIISSRLVSALASNAYLGVSVFFVISGYIITQTSLRRYGNFGTIKIRQFFIYRISRILPPLLLVVCLNLSLHYGGQAGFEIPPQTGVSVGKLLLYIFTFRFNILYLNGGALLPPWAPLWSLAVEEVFYLCFPITSRILRIKIFMSVLFCCVLAQGYFFRAKYGWGSLYCYRGCFDSLSLGCLVATLTSNSAWLDQRAWLARLSRWAGLAVIFLFYLGFDIHKNYDWIWLPLVVSFGAALFLFGCSSTRASAPADHEYSWVYRAVGFAGFLSYELYILHVPILILIQKPVGQLNHLTHGWMPGDVNFVLFAGLMCLLCAGISRYYCEPVLKYLRQKTSRFAKKPLTLCSLGLAAAKPGS